MDFRKGELRVCDLMGRLSEKVKVAGRIVHKSLYINRISGLEPIDPAYLDKQWRRLRLEMRVFREVRRFEFSFSDLCTLLDDSVLQWQEDLETHFSAIQTATEQLTCITSLNLEIAARVREEAAGVEERLRELAIGRKD